MTTRRKLTENEIDRILSAIPLKPCEIPAIAEDSRRQDIEAKRGQLQNVTVTGEKTIEILIERLKRRFINSLVVPGDTPGIAAATSAGSISTQLTLNTFHVAGSNQTLASGVETMRQVANNTKKRKIERTTIHFENWDLTRSEVVDLGNTLIGVELSDLLDVGKPITRMEVDTKEFWYDLFDTSIGLPDLVKNSDSFYRLYFSTYELYKYQVSLSDVADILKSELPDVSIVWSPMAIGVVDIYIDHALVAAAIQRIGDNYAAGFTNRDNEAMFFQSGIKPALDELATETGIKGIKDVQVIEKRTVSYITDEVEYPDAPVGTEWSVYLDKIEVIVSGIPIAKVDALFSACGLETIKYTEADGFYLYHIRMPAEGRGHKPTKWIGKLSDDADHKLNHIRENQIVAGNWTVSINLDIYRHARYVYVEAQTRELSKILSHEAIASDRTICWNANVMYEVLGIEAARNVIAREFYEAITGNGGDIAPAHLYTIADSMTFMGTLMAISSRAATRLGRGPYADGSFETPTDAFVNSATYGREEPVNSTSACISTGVKIPVGTGSVNIEFDPERVEQLLKTAVSSNIVDLSVFERGDLQLKRQLGILEGDENVVKPDDTAGRVDMTTQLFADTGFAPAVPVLRRNVSLRAPRAAWIMKSSVAKPSTSRSSRSSHRFTRDEDVLENRLDDLLGGAF